MATAAIVGASGYAGQETLDRVLSHPGLELYALGSDSLAGEPANALDPRLGRNGWNRIPRFITNEAALKCGADVVFLCLSHEEAARVEPGPRGVVVDLSGAHRFLDPALYEAWYGFEHPAPQALSEWSYGLPEVSPPTGRLVANPGCYATAALLALAPLRGQIEPDAVFVDAKSGMTGAGRALEAELTRRSGARERLAVPGRRAPARARDRGASSASPSPSSRICSRSAAGSSRPATCARPAPTYALLSRSTTRTATSWTCLPEGVVPELARVQQTDGAEIGVFEDRLTGGTIVVCALDNLGKGAAGRRSRT